MLSNKHLTTAYQVQHQPNKLGLIIQKDYQIKNYGTCQTGASKHQEKTLTMFKRYTPPNSNTKKKIKDFFWHGKKNIYKSYLNYKPKITSLSSIYPFTHTTYE